MGNEISLKKSYIRDHWTEISVPDDGACQVLPLVIKKIHRPDTLVQRHPVMVTEFSVRSSNSVQGNIWALNNIPEHCKHTLSKNKYIMKTENN
jgi:hypothetical protein